MCYPCTSLEGWQSPAECTGLENQQRFTPFVGSNPTPSARFWWHIIAIAKASRKVATLRFRDDDSALTKNLAASRLRWAALVRIHVLARNWRRAAF